MLVSIIWTVLVKKYTRPSLVKLGNDD